MIALAISFAEIIWLGMLGWRVAFARHAAM